MALDQVALGMERKWGAGRLRLLVSDFLRAKFDEQILPNRLGHRQFKIAAVQRGSIRRSLAFLVRKSASHLKQTK